MSQNELRKRIRELELQTATLANAMSQLQNDHITLDATLQEKAVIHADDVAETRRFLEQQSLEQSLIHRQLAESEDGDPQNLEKIDVARWVIEPDHQKVH